MRQHSPPYPHPLIPSSSPSTPFAMPAFIQTPFLPLQRFSLRRCVRPPVPVHRRSHRRPVVSSPFSVPIASADDTLVLTEENVVQALNEVRVKLGSVFGNSAENRGVGITGDVSLSELDGPIVVLSLKGRFWHKRADVVSRFLPYSHPKPSPITFPY
ncbi:unnamed protein product [Chondrus crispus]|uniref:Uncharacterized protein n=1 Tax=Chondrus crispus TaxID=2769 RepID=R7QDY0_CHOCR|nr:unnamed protein product [Chondrus crispus]CDF36722.1 unnamed protein product [Chondrus crispus]|eukprot:XP_005716541.1 unnamed protein product [Chondrus crispus]